jgi:MFS family permease
MRNRSTILILGIAQFVMVLDTTVMNVSISQVVADLDTTVTDVQLAITLYALVMGAFMLTGGKLGDIWGRRRTFAIGSVVYGTGSLITALSPSIGVLLFGWSLIEGLGAVLVIPAIMALTAYNYEGKERAVAFGLLGGIAGAGAAAGPLIGGFVTSALTWRVVFAAETVVMLGVLLLVRRIRDAPRTEGAEIDAVGVALSALGLGLVVFGILKSSTWGFIRPTGALTIGGTEITPFGFSAVPFIILIGVIVLGGFSRWERRRVRLGRQPLLRPDLLPIPQLRGGLTMLASTYLVLAGTFFVLPLYLQIVLGKDALETGLKILPISVTMMAGALAGPRLAARLSPRRIVQAGLALMFASELGLMATVSPDLASAPFAISLAVFGAGIGLIVSQLGNVIMSSVDETRSSEAGGLQGTAQNIGTSLGTALIGAILLSGLTSGFVDRVSSDPAVTPQLQRKIAAGSEGGLPMVSKSTVTSKAEQAGLQPDQVAAVTKHYGDAQIEALKLALLWAAVFSLIGLFFTRRLPGAPLSEAEARAPPESVEVAAG